MHSWRGVHRRRRRLPTAGASAVAPDASGVMTFASEEAFGVATQSPGFAWAVEDNESFVERFETFPVDYIPVIEVDPSSPDHMMMSVSSFSQANKGRRSTSPFQWSLLACVKVAW